MDLSPQKKIAIIGAGPAGLAAAFKLTQAGVAVDIFESSAHVGGFCRTISLWGYKVDLGPHRFFSSSARVNQLWQNIISDEYLWVKRQTRIFYKRRFFEYPLRPLNTFIRLGGFESLWSVFSYVQQKFAVSKAPPKNFEEWVIAKFGRRLFETFFKSYSEKLWGIPCRQIDSDFAERKIRQMSIWQLIKKFVSPTKTFVEFFAYPKAGTGATYEKFKERIERRKGTFYFNEPVTQLEKIGGGYRLSTPQRTADYSEVISTMPITSLVQAIGAPLSLVEKSQQLQFRNTILVYLLVEGKDHFPDNWVYVHTPGVDFGRITNFRNWSPEMCTAGEDTVLCIEYWCGSQDGLWTMPEDELISKATGEIIVTKIIPGIRVKDGHVLRLAKTYPVFKVGYRGVLEEVQNYLSKLESLIVIGRYGAFQYNNQDHSLLMGLKAADQILSGQKKELTVFDATYEEDHAAEFKPSHVYDEI